jgi:uncharacterized protein (DUF1800 family)
VEVALQGPALKEHTLNRLGYGQSIWHDARYEELGFSAYVAEQLGGTLGGLAPVGATTDALLRRAIGARRQLEAVLLEFWFNHFNVDGSGGVVKRTVGEHLDAIRPHILGDFGDMLVGTAKSPAMLDYLDNRVNYRSFVNNQGNVFGPNENYARELMELHTLGVDGGYTEGDIIEVARVMTGWSVRNDAYAYKQFFHDTDSKRVLGATFPAGRQEEEGVELLAMLADHPSTASFLSRKLCRKLVSENPPASVVDAGAAAFGSTSGDLAKTVEAIITAPDFTADSALRSKVKPPHRYLASAVLAMGANGRNQYDAIMSDLVSGVTQLGEDPFEVGPPTGYPDASPFWVSSAAMLDRFRLAKTVAYHPGLFGRLKSTASTGGVVVSSTVEKIANRMCPAGISDQTRDAVETYVANNATTNDERVRDAAHAILCSPEFVRF